MFSHIMLGAKNIEESKRFYDAILGELGAKPGVPNPNDKGHMRYLYFHDGSIFVITQPINNEPASHGNGCTIGFKANSPEEVEAWHKAGLENGGMAIENPPGPRGEAPMRFYLAYLEDPAGNKICSMHNM